MSLSQALTFLSESGNNKEPCQETKSLLGTSKQVAVHYTL